MVLLVIHRGDHRFVLCSSGIIVADYHFADRRSSRRTLPIWRSKGGFSFVARNSANYRAVALGGIWYGWSYLPGLMSLGAGWRGYCGRHCRRHHTCLAWRGRTGIRSSRMSCEAKELIGTESRYRHVPFTGALPGDPG